MNTQYKKVGLLFSLIITGYAFGSEDNSKAPKKGALSSWFFGENLRFNNVAEIETYENIQKLIKLGKGGKFFIKKDGRSEYEEHTLDQVEVIEIREHQSSTPPVDVKLRFSSKGTSKKEENSKSAKYSLFETAVRLHKEEISEEEPTNSFLVVTQPLARCGYIKTDERCREDVCVARKNGPTEQWATPSQDEMNKKIEGFVYLPRGNYWFYNKYLAIPHTLSITKSQSNVEAKYTIGCVIERKKEKKDDPKPVYFNQINWRNTGFTVAAAAVGLGAYFYSRK